MPRAIAGRMGWADVPIEIQLSIFRLLKPPVPPQACASLSRERLVDWAAGKTTLFGSPANQDAAFGILLLNKATFQAFAPYYYQNTLVCFRDATTFHRDFLKITTDACLHNLKYVSCILNARDEWIKLRTTRWVQVLIQEWHELSRLVRFEVLLVLGRERSRLEVAYRYSAEDPNWSMETRWLNLDLMMGAELAGLTRRALAKTLRGFSVVREVKPANVSDWSELEHLSLTFMKID